MFIDHRLEHPADLISTHRTARKQWAVYADGTVKRLEPDGTVFSWVTDLAAFFRLNRRFRKQ